MNRETILAVANPVAQIAAAVAQLIVYFDHSHEPAETRAFNRLAAEVIPLH